MTIAGNVDVLDLSLSGVGRFQGEELKTKQAKVRNKGMGSAVVNVSDQLDASVSKEDLQRLTMSLRREDV